MITKAMGATAASVALVAGGAVAAGSIGTAHADKPPKNLVCVGKVMGGEYHHVRVPKGESCKLIGAVVTGNLRARGAVNVKVLDTEVRHNLMVVKASGSVKIGPKQGCRYDPIIGNNIVVRNSHNVLICQMSVDNNITVRRNDGRITVRDNKAGNNIKVNRNKKFVPDGPVGHGNPGAIRLINNEADNHIQVFYNHDSRDLKLRGNSPEPKVK